MSLLKYCTAVSVFDISNNQLIIKKLIQINSVIFLFNFVLIQIHVGLPFILKIRQILDQVLDHYFPDYLVYQNIHKQHTTMS